MKTSHFTDSQIMAILNNTDLVHKFVMCQISVGQANRGNMFRFTVNGVYDSSVGAKYAQSKYPYHEPYKK